MWKKVENHLQARAADKCYDFALRTRTYPEHMVCSWSDSASNRPNRLYLKCQERDLSVFGKLGVLCWGPVDVEREMQNFLAVERVASLPLVPQAYLPMWSALKRAVGVLGRGQQLWLAGLGCNTHQRWLMHSPFQISCYYQSNSWITSCLWKLKTWHSTHVLFEYPASVPNTYSPVQEPLVWFILLNLIQQCMLEIDPPPSFQCQNSIAGYPVHPQMHFLPLPCSSFITGRYFPQLCGPLYSRHLDQREYRMGRERRASPSSSLSSPPTLLQAACLHDCIQAFMAWLLKALAP